jgi:hypothetical protein
MRQKWQETQELMKVQSIFSSFILPNGLMDFETEL